MMAYRNLMLSPWIDGVGTNRDGATFIDEVRLEIPASEWINTTVCTRPDNYCVEEAPGWRPPLVFHCS